MLLIIVIVCGCGCGCGCGCVDIMGGDRIFSVLNISTASKWMFLWRILADAAFSKRVSKYYVWSL